MHKDTADLLRELMTSEGIGENGLARKTGVPQPTIHRILQRESLQPRKSTLQPIATYFNVPVELLISGIHITDAEEDHSNSPNAWPYRTKIAEKSHKNYSGQTQFVSVKSFAQIINSDAGSLWDMKYSGELMEESVFYAVDTDLMEGEQGERIPKGSVLHLVKGVTPDLGDVVLYSVNDSPVLGHYSEVAGAPFVRPSNRQYQSINVEAGELIGVAVEITKKLKSLDKLKG